MASEQNRLLLQQQQHPPTARLKRWGGCLGGLSCFRKQQGGRRIVPASRIPENNALANQPNGHQPGGLPNQTIGIPLSLLAPPSSPASFSNSALPSTVQSPNCFLSANSPRGPSTMFVTGPYAHETQLVSPPVFSTFTTEPSTAPLTPPPELAHFTTPSSPDVPYAHFLSSKIKGNDKTNYSSSNDMQSTYSLYPGSPASALRSPVLRTSGDQFSSSFNEREFPPHWDSSIPSQETSYAKSESGRFLGIQASGVTKPRQDSNFFCPETFAQFYLDQSSFSHSGGRLSISRDTDAYANGVNGHQSRQNKTCKPPDSEELEAYRASFGFSADEIITTTNYVEISDVSEEPFSTTLFNSSNPVEEERILNVMPKGAQTGERAVDFPSPQMSKGVNRTDGIRSGVPRAYSSNQEPVQKQKRFGDGSVKRLPGSQILGDDEDIFTHTGASRIGWKHHFGSSNSDAEIEYRRGRSLRESHSCRENLDCLHGLA